jgi:hypothetical protein
MRTACLVIFLNKGRHEESDKDENVLLSWSSNYFLLEKKNKNV